MLNTILQFPAKTGYLAAIVAVSMSGCFSTTTMFPEGDYVMEIKQLELRDKIRLHSDLSWERNVTYRDHDGVTRELSEHGTATLVRADRRVRVLKFEPFTFVFDDMLPIEKTSARTPLKALNTTMALRQDLEEWLLVLDSEYGYAYHRTTEVSIRTQ